VKKGISTPVHLLVVLCELFTENEIDLVFLLFSIYLFDETGFFFLESEHNFGTATFRLLSIVVSYRAE